MWHVTLYSANLDLITAYLKPLVYLNRKQKQWYKLWLLFLEKMHWMFIEIETYVLTYGTVSLTVCFSAELMRKASVLRASKRELK